MTLGIEGSASGGWTATEWIALLSAVATLVGAIAAGIASVAAFRGVEATKAGVQATQAGVDATAEGVKATNAGVKATNEAAKIAKTVADTQKMLSQRQLLVPLWGYMTSLGKHNTADPDVKQLLNAVHTLELVALCCEGGMVDEQVIKRTFRDVFIDQYRQIEACPKMASLGRDGKALLLENPAAMKFYDQLMQEHKERDALKKA